MSLRWLEGFETHQTSAGLTRLYQSVTWGAGNSFVSGRRFGKALLFDSAALTTLLTPTFAAATVWTVGLAVKVTGSVDVTGAWNLVQLQTSTPTEQICLALANGPSGYFKIQVKKGGLVYYETANLLITGEWSYIEWKVTTDPTTGSFELRVNQVLQLSETGINTAASGTSNSHQVQFQGRSVSSKICAIDDIYVVDGAGSDTQFQTFLGDVSVGEVHPIADATPLGMSPSTGTDHYAVLDDAATDASPETDYVEGSAGQQDFVEIGLGGGEVQGDVLGLQVTPLRWLSATPDTRTLNLYHQRRGGAEAAQLIGSDASVTSLTPDYTPPVVVQADPFDGDRLSIDDVAEGRLGLGVA